MYALTFTDALAIIAVMISLTVLLHLFGLMGLLHLAGHHLRHWRTPSINFDRAIVPLLMVLGLFLLHAAEIWAYAFLFRLAHAVTTWEDALFVSAGAYSTMGYEGTAVPLPWRLVTAWEAMNGILLTGWSTAFLFQNLDRILIDNEEHPLPDSAIALTSLHKDELASSEMTQES